MYRQLSYAEIEKLKQQGCIAESWKNVKVGISFSTESISNVRFAGNVKIGTLNGKVKIDEGIWKTSSIRNCYIENCTIGENVFLSNINNLINYFQYCKHYIVSNPKMILSFSVLYLNKVKLPE